MRPGIYRAATLLSSRQLISTSSLLNSSSSSSTRCFHCATRNWAIAHPITAHGPPPKPPAPATEFKDDIRRAGLESAADQGQPEDQTSRTTAAPDTTTRASQTKPSLLRKRFWKDVNVKESSGKMISDIAQLGFRNQFTNSTSPRCRRISGLARHAAGPKSYQSHPHDPQHKKTFG